MLRSTDVLDTVASGENAAGKSGESENIPQGVETGTLSWSRQIPQVSVSMSTWGREKEERGPSRMTHSIKRGARVGCWWMRTNINCPLPQMPFVKHGHVDVTVTLPVAVATGVRPLL